MIVMIGKNNPFNLRYNARNNWLGQTGETRGFCDFESVEYCIRAVAILIMRSYRKNNILTISEIINRYAPKIENQTDKYVDYICGRLGVLPFDIPSRNMFPILLYYISRFEGNPVELKDIVSVIDFYNIVPYKCK